MYSWPRAHRTRLDRLTRTKRMQAAASALLVTPSRRINLRHCTSAVTVALASPRAPLVTAGSLPTAVTAVDDQSLSATLHPPILEHASLSLTTQGGHRPSDGFVTPRGMTLHGSIHGASNYLKSVSLRATLWGLSSAPEGAENEEQRDSGSSTPQADRSLAAAQKASAAASSSSGVPSWLMRRCSSAGRESVSRRSSRGSGELVTPGKGDGVIVVELESGPLKTAGELEPEAPQCAVSWAKGHQKYNGDLLIREGIA